MEEFHALDRRALTMATFAWAAYHEMELGVLEDEDFRAQTEGRIADAREQVTAALAAVTESLETIAYGRQVLGWMNSIKTGGRGAADAEVIEVDGQPVALSSLVAALKALDED